MGIMLGSNNQPLGDHISIDCARKDRNRLLLQPIYESSACNDFLLSALMQLLQHFLSLCMTCVCVCVVSNYNLLYVEPHHPPLTLSLSHRETGISGSEWAACRVTLNTGKKGREEGRRREPFLYLCMTSRRKSERMCKNRCRKKRISHVWEFNTGSKQKKKERKKLRKLETGNKHIYEKRCGKDKKSVTLWN